MLLMQKVALWIRDKFAFYHIIIAAFQFFGAFILAVTSPLLIRQFLLPSSVKHAVPLHFNFETCREQLAGICSFPTATVDFSVENPKLSPGEHYEMIIEIVLSESTIISNVGIFQAVVELVDQRNVKRTFRRSCFANRHRGVIYRMFRGWWNLACQTVFFPAYFFGMLTVLDDRKLEVSFTNRLVCSDLANTALLYVQLQNRFIEVESGILVFNVRFGLLRVFLHNYPIVSSLLIIIFTYFICLIGIALYWLLPVVLRFCRLFATVPEDEMERPAEVCTEIATTELLERSEIEGDTTFLVLNNLRRYSDKALESFPHRRNKENERNSDSEITDIRKL
ncbi:unnamed protein product [Litomosoides sigmodontis]|uniref:Seipin n=1 Tax=Litomosoides sigmodontis TaxID=42156 RepID=A0A3P6UZV5_LITSI|nr:unnamed protein product [Litomosoides sigmodontis]